MMTMATRAGLIPAYAGSTAYSVGKILAPRAHPRLRGEHRWKIPLSSLMRGSSPLTRGARGVLAFCEVASGLIPAYAGSTSLYISESSMVSAHPRLRGEHGSVRRIWTRWTGSSPLTRGAPHTPASGGRVSGLIPAYAGSTLADMHVSEPKVDFRSDLVERRTSSVDCDERYEQCSIRCAAETLTARPAAA